MTGWTYAKYLLALSGIALVLAGESTGRRWLGYIGIGLLVAGFLLRFIQRARQRKAA